MYDDWQPTQQHCCCWRRERGGGEHIMMMMMYTTPNNHHLLRHHHAITIHHNLLLQSSTCYHSSPEPRGPMQNRCTCGCRVPEGRGTSNWWKWRCSTAHHPQSKCTLQTPTALGWGSLASTRHLLPPPASQWGGGLPKCPGPQGIHGRLLADPPPPPDRFSRISGARDQLLLAGCT